MTIVEYKQKKLIELKKFLRGINFEKIGKVKYERDEKSGNFILDDNGNRIIKEYASILKNFILVDEGLILKTDFINQDKEYRDLFLKFINEVNYLRLGLEDSFQSKGVFDELLTQKDIDSLSNNFINRVIRCFEKFKIEILKRISGDDPKLMNRLLEMVDLSSIKIMFGDKEYNCVDLLDYNQDKKNVNSTEVTTTEEKTVDNLEELIIGIYTLIPDLKDEKKEFDQMREKAIKEKKVTDKLKSRMGEFINQLFNANIFNNTGRQANRIKYYWFAIKNSKSKKEALEKFKDFVSFLENELNEFWNDIENIESNTANGRYILLNDMCNLAKSTFLDVEENPKKL